MTTGGGAVEAATGLNVMPYENIDSLPDLLKHIGTSALPFSVQGHLEGEATWTWPFSFFGARVSAGTTWEATQRARNAEAQARGFKGWDDPKLDEPTKYQIDQTPKVAGLLTKLEQEGENRPQTPEGRYYTKVDEVRAGQLQGQQTDDDLYNAGKITAPQWRDRTATRNRDVWAAMQQAQKDFGITFEDKETTNPVDAAIAAYYAVDADNYKDETGAVNWDQFSADREAALAPLSTAERGLVDDFIHKLWTPTQWDMFRKEQQLQDYYNIPDTVYTANKRQLGVADESYTAFKTRELAEAGQRAVADGKPAEAGSNTMYWSPALRELEARIADQKALYLHTHDKERRLLLQLGLKPWSQEDIALQGGGATTPTAGSGGGLDMRNLPALTLPGGGRVGNLPILTLPTYGQ
jgi:hypothetical protein